MNSSRLVERPEMKRRVLIFVEDPGAANYLLPIIEELLRLDSYDLYILADGVARDFLSRGAIPFEAVEAEDSASGLILEYSPNMLLVGTAESPDSLGLSLVTAARAGGVVSVAVIDAAMSSDMRFCGRSGDPLAHLPDWLLLPDETTRKAFTDLGAPGDRLLVCGHPHYDYVSEMRGRFDIEGVHSIRAELFGSLNASKNIVVFISEGSARVCEIYQIDPSEYSFAGRGGATGRTEILLEEFLDALAPVRRSVHVVFRMHPKDLKTDYSHYCSEVDEVNSGGSPLKLLYAADLVVGMTSMSLLEAILLGRPSLAIIPRSIEKKWLPGVRDDLIPSVTDREQLRNALVGALAHKGPVPEKDGIVMFGAVPRVISFIGSVLTNIRMTGAC
jgi:hypothetical protein